MAMPEPDIEFIEPDSVVVPAAPVEPVVLVEPETLPLAPDWPPLVLVAGPVAVVEPVLAEPVVPPVVPAEADVLGEVVEPLVPVAVASGVALVFAEPLAVVLPVPPATVAPEFGLVAPVELVEAEPAIGAVLGVVELVVEVVEP